MAVDGKEVKQLYNPGIGGDLNYTFIKMIISHIWDFSSRPRKGAERENAWTGSELEIRRVRGYRRWAWNLRGIVG